MAIPAPATVTEESLAGFPALRGTPTTAHGARPPILLLHGAFADHHSFHRWVAHFASLGYPTYAPARRGRLGIGPEGAAGLTFDDYVTDTQAAIDALARPPILIGHSLGALVAQRLAEQGQAAAIALLASAPPGMLTAQPAALPHFAPLLPRIMTGRSFVVAPRSCSALALNQVPASERAAIHAHLTPESGKVYRAMMLGTIRVDARKVAVPVFVAGGAQDRIVAPGLVRKTAKHYGVAAHLYPDAGHWIIDEPATAAVLSDVERWLISSLSKV